MSDPYDPWDFRRPHDDGEIYQARMQTPTRHHPIVGAHVLYRHEPHGDTTDAIVLEVQDRNEGGDPNLLLPDPWVTLVLDTAYGRLKTRESRARGSAGWLHLEDMFK